MSLYGSVGANSIRSVPGPHPLLATGLAPSRKRKDRDDPDVRIPSSSSSSNASALPPLPLSSSSSLLGLPRPPHVRHPPLVEQRLGKQQQQLLNPYPAPAPSLVPATPTPLAKPGGNRILVAGYLAHEFLSRGTLFGRPYGTSTAAAGMRKEEMQKRRRQQYDEVARILWGGGAHVPGVINPTQLGAWLQKQQER